MSISSVLNAGTYTSSAPDAIGTKFALRGIGAQFSQGKVTPFATVVSDIMTQAEQQPAPDTKVQSNSNDPLARATVTPSATTATSPQVQSNSVFFGYNGKAYSLSPPEGDSFLGSNGQTYTKQQVKDFYKSHPGFGEDIAAMAKLGLKPPDLYKARALAGQGEGTGIYTDPKEMTAFSDYYRSAVEKNGSASGVMAFNQWRDQQSTSYLAALQTGVNDNIGWLNGPAGGIPVGGPDATLGSSTLALAARSSNTSTA